MALVVQAGDERRAEQLWEYRLTTSHLPTMVSYIDRLNNLNCLIEGSGILPESIIIAYEDAQKKKELNTILKEQHTFLKALKGNSDEQKKLQQDQKQLQLDQNQLVSKSLKSSSIFGYISLGVAGPGRARTPVPLKQSPNRATEKPACECAISVAPLGLWHAKYVFRALPGPAIIAPDLRSFKANQTSGMQVRRPLDMCIRVSA
jgi:hypothetical protein